MAVREVLRPSRLLRGHLSAEDIAAAVHHTAPDHSAAVVAVASAELRPEAAVAVADSAAHLVNGPTNLKALL